MHLKYRDVEILTWLVHMKFMTLDQIGRAFFKDCNPNRACYRRILKLIKGGYIATRKVYTDPKDVYVPTRKVVKLLEQDGFPYAIGLPKDKSFPNFGHERTLVDIRILFHELGISTYIPERIIRSMRPTGACPDAIVITANCIYAIEYEHTEKRLERYQRILERYEIKEHYDKVLYITPTETLRERIKKKYPLPDHIFFISKEALFRDRERAVFFSSKDGFDIDNLMDDSSSQGLETVNPEFLKEVVRPGKEKSWKNKQRFIHYEGGQSKRHEVEERKQFSLDERFDNPEYQAGEARMLSVQQPFCGQDDDDAVEVFE